MSKIKLALGVLLVGGATVAVGKCIYDKVVENRKAKEDANDEMFSDESIDEICKEVVQAVKDIGDEYDKKLKETFDNFRNTTKETDDEAVATVDAVVTDVDHDETPEEKSEEESFTKAVDDAKEAFKEVLNDESEQQ